MPIEQEIEFKNLLTKAEMDLLLQAFKVQNQDFFTQTNLYLDTPKLTLRKANMMLRIRKSERDYELTLKQPDDIGLKEINQSLDQNTCEFILKKQQLPAGIVLDTIRTLTNETNFVMIAQLETKRATIPYEGQKLFFDISTYYDVTDYEVELEALNHLEGEKIFNQLLSQFNIPRRPAPSKVARAFSQRQK